MCKSPTTVTLHAFSCYIISFLYLWKGNLWELFSPLQLIEWLSHDDFQSTFILISRSNSPSFDHASQKGREEGQTFVNEDRCRQGGSLPPLSTFRDLTDASFSDIWHEKREPTKANPLHLNIAVIVSPYHWPAILIGKWRQKKGAQAQKQIQQIQSQAAQAKTPDQKRKEAEKAQREKEKAASEQAKRETAELFKPVQVQKVPFGVDPKTVVCTFYKQGNCEKGKKCKFSHDLAVERKGEKKNLYQDTREGEDEAKKKDDMAEWDEGKSTFPGSQRIPPSSNSCWWRLFL